MISNYSQIIRKFIRKLKFCFKKMLPNFDENQLNFCAWLIIGIAVFSFIASFFINTPYGRYSSYSWGFGVNASLAWLLQECPSFLIPFAMCLGSGNIRELMSLNVSPNIALLYMFMMHYFRRYVAIMAIFSNDLGHHS